MDIESLIRSPFFGLLAGLSLLGLALLIIGAIVWRRRTATRRATRRAIKAIAHEVLHDVLIPDGMGGQIHIDHLLLTASGVLVLEIKDVFGTIFGSDQMEDWTVINGNQRFTIRNPQAPLYDRVAAIRQVTPDIPVAGRIAFTANGEFTKGLPRFVVSLTELANEFGMPGDAEAARRLEAFYPFWERIKQALAIN